MSTADTLTIALSKGRIFKDTLPLLRQAGIEPLDDPETSRKLILDTLGSGGWPPPRGGPPEPGTPGQLYDLDDDPAETRNLWEAQPELVAEMAAMAAAMALASPGSASRPLSSWRTVSRLPPTAKLIERLRLLRRSEPRRLFILSTPSPTNQLRSRKTSAPI